MSSLIRKIAWLAGLFLLLPIASVAAPALKPLVDRPFSAGVLLGYGTTNWRMLDAYCQGDAACLMLLPYSTPVNSDDSGFAYGLQLGYQIEENFALELTYRRFANTRIYFAQYNSYKNLPHDKATSITSSVFAYSLMGKFYAPMGSSAYYAYASGGPSITHRYDALSRFSHVNFAFGMGLGRVLWERLRAEVDFFYSTGYDHATMTPAESYVPFLFSANLRLAYIF